MKKIYSLVLLTCLSTTTFAMDDGIPRVPSDGSPHSPTTKRHASFLDVPVVTADPESLSRKSSSVSGGSSERLLALRKSFIEPYKERGKTRNAQPTAGRYFLADPTCDEAVKVLILELTVDNRPGDPNFNYVADVIDFAYYRKVTPEFRQEFLEDLAQNLKTRATPEAQTPYLEDRLLELLGARVKKLMNGPFTTK